MAVMKFMQFMQVQQVMQIVEVIEGMWVINPRDTTNSRYTIVGDHLGHTSMQVTQIMQILQFWQVVKHSSFIL